MSARHYQESQVDLACELVSSKRKIVVQLPTGGGKTFEFAMITDRFIKNTGKSVLILVHRKELMQQAAKTIREMTGIEPCLITADTKHTRIARVYIGMVESLVRRLDCFREVHLVIVDECHINSFNKIHNIFLDEFIIGFTATPISASKREPVNKYYRDIIVGPQINELIMTGYLAQNRTRCIKDIVDTAKFALDSLKGDYNERQMANEYKLPQYIKNVVIEYEKWCNNEKTIVFNVNIDHSREVASCLSFCGFNAKHLASDNEHERDEILKWFKETEDAILCNVGIATVGFDEPTVKNIILNFSTLSLAKYLQTCGRGSRFIDQKWLDKYQKDYPYKVKIKDHFNIIDMGGNYGRFGDWNWDRDWETMFRYPPTPGDGVAPVKTCPKCFGLVHAAVKICPMTDEHGELCLHEFVKQKTPEEYLKDEMVLVTKVVGVDQIVATSSNKHYYYPMDRFAEPVVKTMFETFGRNPEQKVIDKYFKYYYSICVMWYKKEHAWKEDWMDGIEDSGFHIKKAQNIFNNLCTKYTSADVKHTKLYDWNQEESDNEDQEVVAYFGNA